VRSKLTEITGDDWSTKDVDLFFQLYDPPQERRAAHQLPALNAAPLNNPR
jgi:hypothetical protein